MGRWELSVVYMSLNQFEAKFVEYASCLLDCYLLYLAASARLQNQRLCRAQCQSIPAIIKQKLRPTYARRHRSPQDKQPPYKPKRGIKVITCLITVSEDSPSSSLPRP